MYGIAHLFLGAPLLTLRVSKRRGFQPVVKAGRGPYRPAFSWVFFFFSRKMSAGFLSASTATWNQPIIISSQVWSPQRTSAFGSGLYRLLGELSKCAVQSIRVPLGSTTGSEK